MFLACRAPHEKSTMSVRVKLSVYMWVWKALQSGAPWNAFSENIVRNKVDVGIFFDKAKDFVGNLENCDFSWHHFWATELARNHPYWTHK